MVAGFNNGYQAKDSNILDIKVVKCGDCDYMKQQPEEKIYVPFDIWTEWQWIMKKMSDKEWQAVYDVQVKEVFPADGKDAAVSGPIVTAYRIPKQTVTGTSAEFVNEPESSEQLKGDGIIHSHHNLGLHKHSGQDDSQSRNLYDWSILLFNGGTGVEASRRIKSPCGGFGFVKATVFLIGCPEIDLSNISEKTWSNTSYVYRGAYDSNIPDDTEGEVKQPRLPFTERDTECKACSGTGISSNQTLCEACKGSGSKNSRGYGDAKDEILESDVCFRCNKCHKFFDIPNMGLCPRCDSPNWRRTTGKELVAINEDTICKKCPETDCTGCPVEIPEITEF
jgi:hypothetical protein